MKQAVAEEISAKLSAAPGGAVEASVIEESQWGAIRALSQRGLAKKAIARQLGLDIKTVRRWLREPYREQRRRKRGQVLDRWRGFLQGRAPEVAFCAVEKTRKLADTPTRLKSTPANLQERLINWGYAVCDAAMRKHVDEALAAPSGFPYPRVGVG